MSKHNKIHNTSDNQDIKNLQICSMNLHIGEKIQQHIKDSNITIKGFADMINKERSNVYDIFKRESIDTGLLAIISKVLKYDFFKFYSDELKKEMNILDEPNPANNKSEHEKRRIMIEVNLSEKEYQDLIRKRVM